MARISCIRCGSVTAAFMKNGTRSFRATDDGARVRLVWLIKLPSSAMWCMLVLNLSGISSRRHVEVSAAFGVGDSICTPRFNAAEELLRMARLRGSLR